MPTAWRPNDPRPAAFQGSEGLRRSVAAPLGQGLPGRAVGRAERRVRRPLQHHVAEERVLVEAGTVGGGRGGRRRGAHAAAVHGKRSDLRQGLPHRATPTKCSRLLDAEGGYWYHAHPRTKSTAGFPDATWGTKYLKNDRYLGVAFKPGMGQDNSEADDVRVALLRRRRHDEQHERRHWASGRSSSSPTSTRTGRAPKTTRTRTSRSTI